MKKIIFLLLLPARLFANTNAYDIVTDMEVGSAGDLLNADRISQCSHTNGNLGGWSVVNTGTLYFTNQFNSTPRGPVTVAGTPYLGAGDTRTLALDLKQNVPREYAKFTLGTGRANLSVGFSFRYTSAGTVGDYYDLFALEGGAEFMNVSVENRTAGTSRIGLETSVCTSVANIGYKTISDDTKYWVTFQWNKNTTCYMQVFDMSTWRSLFRTNCAVGNANCTDIYVGRYDNHTTANGGVVYYDNLTVDVTGSTFPLLPKGATINAQSTSRTAFDECYTNAVNASGDNRVRDTILFPAASSNAWTSGYTVAKTLIISGSSSNAIVGTGSIIAADGFAAQDRLFNVTGNFVTISNLQVTGRDFTGAWLIVNDGKWEVLRDIHFYGGLAATISYNPGVCYNCSFYNVVRMGRWFNLNNGQDNIDAGYITPYDITMFGTTNFFSWENNKMSNNAAIDTQVVISGEAGGMGICRFCDIWGDATGWDPVFDMHGGLQLSPTEYSVLATQIYKNTVHITGGGDVGRWIDQRGGACMNYSNNCDNSCTLDLRVAIQNVDFYHNPGKEVTNTWCFNNIQNGSDMPPNVLNPADIQLHIHYESTAPTTLYATPYPHPLRHDAASSGGGGGTQADPAGVRRVSRMKRR